MVDRCETCGLLCEFAPTEVRQCTGCVTREAALQQVKVLTEQVEALQWLMDNPCISVLTCPAGWFWTDYQSNTSPAFPLHRDAAVDAYRKKNTTHRKA